MPSGFEIVLGIQHPFFWIEIENCKIEKALINNNEKQQRNTLKNGNEEIEESINGHDGRLYRRCG